MNLTFVLQDDACLVRMAGRLDAMSADDALRQLQARIAAGASNLVIDASELEYLSSAGIRTLLVSAKAVAKAGRRFSILNARPLVRTILTDCGLDACLGLAPNQGSGR